MTMRPMWCVSRRSSMWAQVLPPSVDLYSPSPQETLLRGLASPVPTQTTSGLEGATATSPIETVLWLSKIGVQVMPLLTVFQRPPDAVATYRVVGRPSTTATSTTRPPMLAGPSGRARKASRRRASGAGSAAGLERAASARVTQAASSTAAGRVAAWLFMDLARRGDVRLAGVIEPRGSVNPREPWGVG